MVYSLSHKSRKSSLSPISPTYTLHKKASSLRVVDFVKYISRQSTTSKASIITELTIRSVDHQGPALSPQPREKAEKKLGSHLKSLKRLPELLNYIYRGHRGKFCVTDIRRKQNYVATLARSCSKVFARYLVFIWSCGLLTRLCAAFQKPAPEILFSWKAKCSSFHLCPDGSPNSMEAMDCVHWVPGPEL